MKTQKYVQLITLSTLFLCALIYIPAYAVEAVSQGKSEAPPPSSFLEMITGEGSASVLESVDIEEAKGKAIGMAKNEAILKVAGLYLSPEILAKERENLSKAFSAAQDKVIEEYKIVSEDRGEDGFYRVKISAKIKEDALKALLMENLYDDRVIVVTSEKNLGNILKRHVLEHELIAKIKEKGYQIVDYRTIKDKRVTDLVASIRQGNTESVKKMGIYYLTDLVVVGFVESEFSEKTKEIYSAHATGQVKVHQIGSKKEILSLTRHNIKGFGSDEEKAGIDAIKKISSEMTNEFAKGLPRKSSQKIKVTIREIGNYVTFRKAKGMIERIPYVHEVKDGLKDFAGEEVTIFLETSKSVDYLAAKFTELKVFVVKQVHESEIFVEARKII